MANVHPSLRYAWVPSVQSSICVTVIDAELSPREVEIIVLTRRPRRQTLPPGLLRSSPPNGRDSALSGSSRLSRLPPGRRPTEVPAHSRTGKGAQNPRGVLFPIPYGNKGSHSNVVHKGKGCLGLVACAGYTQQVAALLWSRLYKEAEGCVSLDH